MASRGEPATTNNTVLFITHGDEFVSDIVDFPYKPLADICDCERGQSGTISDSCLIVPLDPPVSRKAAFRNMSQPRACVQRALAKLAMSARGARHLIKSSTPSTSKFDLVSDADNSVSVHSHGRWK